MSYLCLRLIAAAVLISFAAGAAQIRKEAQDKYGREALETLRSLALEATSEAGRINAGREYLKQVLGRQESPPTDKAAEDDTAAKFAAIGRSMREKLYRIADAATAAADRDGTDG